MKPKRGTAEAVVRAVGKWVLARNATGRFAYVRYCKASQHLADTYARHAAQSKRGAKRKGAK